MPRPFLTAEWRNVFLATYTVPPALLQPRLPAGLELDTRDGDAFVSLVAFQFCNTRVLGIAWPGYTNFAELNLRFYVHHGGERGVVFVCEFVPARMVAWMARLLYNEPYRAAPLSAVCTDEPDRRGMEYRLEWAGRSHRITVSGSKPGFVPAESSMEHFFKEHRWGFGVSRRGQPRRYEVVHSHWEVLPVQSFHVDLDWASVYGPEWGFLAAAVPCSTILAVGSPIAVYPHGKVEPAGATSVRTGNGLSTAVRPQ